MIGLGRGRGRGRERVFQGNPFAQPEENQTVIQTVFEPVPSGTAITGWGGGGRGRGRGRTAPAEEVRVISEDRRPRKKVVSSVKAGAEEKDGKRKEERKEALDPGLLWDVEVLSDIPQKKVHTWQVRRVVSPHEFYLSYHNLPDDRSFDLMSEHMQLFYRSKKVRSQLEMEKSPVLGGCYACWNLQDGLWYRVRVVKVLQETETAVVFYLDLCMLQEVKLHRILQLHQQYFQTPAQLFRCYLVDIAPKESKFGWTDRSKIFITHLMQDRVVSGIVVTSSEDVQITHMPDIVATLGVCIRLLDPETEELEPGCTVNAKVVDAGFGVVTGVFGLCQHGFQVGVRLPNFPAEDIATPKVKERLNYKKFVTLSKQKAIGKEVTQKDMVIAFSQGNNARLPLEISECLAVVADGALMYNPAHMIVQLQSKKMELDAMEKAIGKTVKSEEEGLPGVYVACVMSTFSNDTKEDAKRWRRGMIRSVVKSGELYAILLVDYGTEITVKRQDMRSLPFKFRQIPSFALRVHLNGKPRGSKTWSEKATDDFHSIFEKLGGDHLEGAKKNRVFMIYPSSEMVKLDQFTQQLKYSVQQRKWITKGTVKDDMYKHFNQLRMQPMLAPLFHSLGVDILWEVPSPTDQYWKFTSLLETWDCWGEATQTFERGGSLRAKIHLEAMENAKSTMVERSPEVMLRCKPKKSCLRGWD